MDKEAEYEHIDAAYTALKVCARALKNGYFDGPKGKFQQLTDALYDVRQEQKMIRETQARVCDWIHTLCSQVTINCDLELIHNEKITARISIAEEKALWTKQIKEELDKCYRDMIACGGDIDCIYGVKPNFPPQPWPGPDER